MNKRVRIEYRRASGDGMGGQDNEQWFGIDVVLLDESGDAILDESGNRILSDYPSDDDPAEVWADVKPTGGEETFDQQALQQNLTHRIVTRYRDDLKDLGYDYQDYDGELRAKFQGRTFNIKSVVNRGEENRYVELQCQEEVRA